MVVDDGAARPAGPAEVCSHEPSDEPTFHVPSYDCSESMDVGYSSGVPFDITVVQVDGEPVEKETANAYWVMREAAAADGVDIHINSGFRTMAEQEYFWMCYQCGCCNNGNLAAQPGYSNHQSGHALDLNASAPGVYNWLVAHGGSFGFSATVPSENWHWEWWGGGPGGGICDIAAPPSGLVTATGCETISGWAADPDTPDDTVIVDVVIDGDPGDPDALQYTVNADILREDLCEDGGSCDHGFEVEVPLGLRDNAPHSVRVFAYDTDGGEATELSLQPLTMQCAPPDLAGVRRLVPDASAFATWQFSDLYDVAYVDQAAIDALPEGAELGIAPFLVTDASGTTTWLVDKGFRREVDDETAQAWHFDLSMVQVLDDADLQDIAEGSALPASPLVATADGAQMWLVDDPQSGLPGGDGGGSAGGDGGDGDGGDGGGSAGGDGGGDTDGESLPGADGSDDGACACRSTDSRGGPLGWGLVLLVLGAVRPRRR